jgi:hypothetical protein
MIDLTKEATSATGRATPVVATAELRATPDPPLAITG